MFVRVKFFGDLRNYLNKSWTLVEVPQGSSIHSFILKLANDVGSDIPAKLIEKDDIKSGIRILVNGRNINYLSRLDTILNDGDLITIMPVAGGG